MNTVNELRNRAKDALLIWIWCQKADAEQVSQDLRALEGLTEEMIVSLAAGIHQRDDLADLADELSEITGQSPEEATALIMLARAHWFTGENTQASS